MEEVTRGDRARGDVGLILNWTGATNLAVESAEIGKPLRKQRCPQKEGVKPRESAPFSCQGQLHHRTGKSCMGDSGPNRCRKYPGRADHLSPPLLGQGRPSRPGEFHPEPLTDPDLT